MLALLCIAVPAIFAAETAAVQENAAPKPIEGTAATAAVQENAAPKPIERTATTAVNAGQERDCRIVKDVYPNLDVNLMLRFYGEYADDLLENWKRLAAEKPDVSSETLKRMARHFLQLEEIRLTDRQEYDRLLEYEVLQKQMRLLGKEIWRLKSIDETGLDDVQKATRDVSIQKGLEQLKLLLEQAFDESIRQQLYEIDKLELEIENLRQMVDERRLKRKQTLQQRFKSLTGGVEMP